MDYKIIQKNAFKIAGKEIKISTKDEGYHRLISEFWERCFADGTCEKISALDKTQNMLGIAMDFDYEKEQLSYMIAVEDVSNLENIDFDIREIPAANWAVFTSIGPLPDAIAEVLSRIYQEWFPATGFEQADGPVIEVYLPGNTSAQDYKCEVWIPVVKNN